MNLLADVHERNAWLTPRAPALVFENTVLTYQDYWTRINRIADGLRLIGARKQDRIALLSMNRPEFVEVYGACERAGFIMTTLNFRLAAAEMRYVLADSDPYALIFEEQYAEIIDGLRPLIGVKQYICIDNAPAWAKPYEAVIEAGSPAGPPFRAEPDDAALIMYTSGTTGRPKGVLRLQRGEVGWAEVMAGQIGVRGDTRHLLMMPFFHAGARSQYIASFWRGGTVHMHRRFDPALIVQAIEADRITHLHLAPTMLQDVLAVSGIERRDLSSVELILNGAAPLPLPVLKRGLAVFGSVFANGYGSTECHITCLAPHQFHLEGTAEEQRRLGSVGQPGIDVDLRIVDDSDAFCGPGVPGEVVCRSATLLGSYWNNGPATIEAMRGGWFHTGDIGYLDQEGYLFLVDRKKDMIISGGENIYCREVEEALLNHPAISDVAVIGVPDQKWGESVKAVAVLKPGAAVTAEALIDYARGQIARYKCPKSVVFTKELPRLSSGKISKIILRTQFGASL